jgi:hypothetical protein
MDIQVDKYFFTGKYIYLNLSIFTYVETGCFLVSKSMVKMG